MKKEKNYFKSVTKKDIVFATLLIAFVTTLIWICGDSDKEYGSKVDWIKQHFAFADYFRKQFYETGNLFPQFSKNIGAGQNIYNFSYYGLLSPIIILSYLFPGVTMAKYIILSTIMCVYLSAILMLVWLRRNKFSSGTSFLASVAFVCCAPIIFHSHRHIMFVNYMPFLILAFMGVDDLVRRKKTAKLVLSSFLIIMTSYFYSVAGLSAICVYWLFRYARENEDFERKKVLKDTIRFGVCMITAVCMAGILIFPTLKALLAGRSEATTQVSILKLLLPDFNATILMYDSYGMGFTFIAIAAIIYAIMCKRTSYKILGIIMAVIIYLPIGKYILNGTLYIRAKALIPYIPIVVYMIAIFIRDIFENKINLKVLSICAGIAIGVMAFFTKLSLVLLMVFDFALVLLAIVCYQKTGKKYWTYILITIYSACVCFAINMQENYVTNKDIEDVFSADKQALIDEIIAEDQDFYRFQDLSTTTTCNMVYNPRYYMTSLYSSSYAKNYKEFHMEIFNNANATKNNITCENSSNILFETLMGVKYIILKRGQSVPFGYHLVKTKGKYIIYRNDNVYSLGYASSNIVSYDAFETLDEDYKAEALLSSIVANEGGEYTDLKLTESTFELPFIKDGSGAYIVNLEKDLTVTIPIPFDTSVSPAVINLEFDKVPESVPVIVKINDVTNTLSSKKSPYPNGNLKFNYVISTSKKTRKIVATFSAGSYKIVSANIYSIHYDEVKAQSENIDRFVLNDSDPDNEYSGTINVTQDGYFMMTVPYDENFVAYVDGEKVEIEEVNTTFIGFPIQKGEHQIRIVYYAPLYKFGAVVSILGCVWFVIMQLIYLQKGKIKV